MNDNDNDNDKTKVKSYIYHKVCKKSPNDDIFSEMNFFGLLKLTQVKNILGLIRKNKNDCQKAARVEKE